MLNVFLKIQANPTDEASSTTDIDGPFSSVELVNIPAETK